MKQTLKQWLLAVPRWAWCFLLLSALFLPEVYIIVCQLWYLSVFLKTKESAAEHYTDTCHRYFTVTTCLIVCSGLYDIAAPLYTAGWLPISTHFLSIAKTIILFVLLLLQVWQLVILLNAYSYARDGINFKNSRARYLLYFILAPIGAYFIK